MSLDDLTLSASKLTDAQVRLLRDTFAQMACDPVDGRSVQKFYADAAINLNAVLERRAWQWVRLLSDPAVPPSWQVAVDTLPPEGGDCR